MKLVAPSRDVEYSALQQQTLYSAVKSDDAEALGDLDVAVNCASSAVLH